MANKLVCVGLYLTLVATLFNSCTAQSHTVGDSLGWNTPPGGAIAYQTWAATQNFNVGDNITFQWTGTHDVVQVTQNGFDNCDASGNNSLSTVQRTSPFTFTLNSTEPQYYICTVSNHCNLGQRVTLRVGEGGGSSSTSPLIKTRAFAAILFVAVFAILF